MTRQLQHEMRRRTEARKAERFTVLQRAQRERAPTNSAGAEQRRCFWRGKILRNRMHERGGNDELVGVATVRVTTRRAKLHAESLVTGATELAHTARRVNPCDADGVAFAMPRHVLPHRRNVSNH